MLHYISICMRSKSVFQTFKILFQTGDISSYAQLKSSFSEQEKISDEI